MNRETEEHKYLAYGITFETWHEEVLAHDEEEAEKIALRRNAKGGWRVEVDSITRVEGAP